MMETQATNVVTIPLGWIIAVITTLLGGIGILVAYIKTQNRRFEKYQRADTDRYIALATQVIEAMNKVTASNEKVTTTVETLYRWISRKRE